MTKITAANVARFSAISSKMKPANDQGAPAEKPKSRLGLQDFVGTVEITQVKADTGTNGKPFMTLKDAIVTTSEGKVSTRTVMAFEAYGLVMQAAQTGAIVATLRHTGPTLKIVGVQIDGEMLMAEAPAAKAA